MSNGKAPGNQLQRWQEQGHCENCSNKLIGPFCSQCGQKVIDHRDRTLRKILADFVTSLFLVENKIYRSLKLLFVSPATLPRTFVEGNTIRFVKPIQFFLLANLIYYLAPQVETFNTPYRTQMNGLPYSDVIAPKVRAHLTAREMEESAFEMQFNQTSNQVAKLIVVVLAPLLGFVFWGLHFHKKELYAGDHIAVALYMLTFTIFFFAVLLPIGFRVIQWFFPSFVVSEKALSLLVLGGLGAYVTILFRGVYEDRLLVSIGKAVVFTICFIPLLHLFRFILLLVTIAFTIYW